jgi:hypothetical protein
MKLVGTAAMEIRQIPVYAASAAKKQKRFLHHSRALTVGICFYKRKGAFAQIKKRLSFRRRAPFSHLLKRHGGFYGFFPTVI